MENETNKFFEYLKEVDRKNMHNKLEKITIKFSNNIAETNNIILYGCGGIGKYSQALNIIRRYSESDLKYEKKTTVIYNKNEYYIKISDIHYEVDFTLLGCNSKTLWNNIYKNICDIIKTKKEKSGIILCKNFHCIDNELLEIFYSFIQKNPFNNLTIRFIFLCEHISFLPKNIVESSLLLHIPKPSNHKYKSTLGIKNIINYETLKNIKTIKHKIDYYDDIHIKNCNHILEYIINYNDINILQLRDYLYNIFIYQLNLDESIYYIISKLIEKKYINDNNVFDIFKNLYNFYKYYNNNYRPIYHLENFIINLIRIIHEF